MATPVSIRCLCPGTPHEGDTVYLRDRLDFRQAVAVRNEIRLASEDGGSPAEYLAALSEAYLLHGIESWTLVDEKGKPIGPSRENIRAVLLTEYDEAEAVANAADALYTEKVVLPLLVRGSTSSQGSQTDESTSPTTLSGGEPPTPPSPSSISTIPTAGTATTSTPPGGDSRRSRRSASAA